VFNQDTVTKDEINARIDELADERDSFMAETGLDEIEDSDAWEEAIEVWEKNQPEGIELRMLLDIVEEIGDADYLVAGGHWEDYVQQMLEDCGDIPSNLPWYVVVDWEQTAKNVASDYSIIEIAGEDWYYRF